jgi:hypothetical protein
MKHPEIVSAYFLCHGHWTVIPHQLEANFRDMRDCGFNAVSISFSESEMVYSRRAVELQVELAHRCGLKVFVIPSRLGGRLAGAPLMASTWLAQHPEAIAGNPWLPLACVENLAFRTWVGEFMATLMHDYDFDGIVWDEPKYVDFISWHPDTLAQFGPKPSHEDMICSFLHWLEDLTRGCLAIRPNLAVTYFAQKPESPSYTRRAAAISGVHYFGFDGNLARQSYFHEEPAWLKYRLESVWERTREEASAAGKKTFALVENMLMPSVAIPEYEENLDRYLSGVLPDHLSLYYYAHNNEDPERTHAVTRRLMQKHL